MTEKEALTEIELPVVKCVCQHCNRFTIVPEAVIRFALEDQSTASPPLLKPT